MNWQQNGSSVRKFDGRPVEEDKIQDNDELTAVVRSRQPHIYRNTKKILVLAGKSQPKIIREDILNSLLNK